MTRDFSKDLTIMVAGSANVTPQHLEESLGEWIFPNVDTEREVHVILPTLSQMGPGIRNLIKLGMQWDFQFTVIQAKDAPLTRELSGLPERCFVRADTERQALDCGFQMLGERAEAGDETAFILAYNPKNTYEQGNESLSDFEIIGDAKMHSWLTTLNLCDSLLDSFEGYKSAAEQEKEDRFQKEFDDKKKAEEALKPQPEKKAPVPRKRAAKKTMAPKVTEPVEEPEKAVQAPSEPLRNSKGQTEEEAKQEDAKVWADIVTTVESGDGVILPGHPDYVAALVGPDPRNELSASVPLVIGPDIQDDIREAHAQIEQRSMVSVSRDDLAELSQNIKELTGSFGKIMDTFTRILKDG